MTRDSLETDRTILYGLTQEGFTDGPRFDASIFSEERINAIREIIRHFLYPSKQINILQSPQSYPLKHILEDYAATMRDSVLGNYVSNGECIYAMFCEGYSIKRINKGLNARFNVSGKSVSALKKQILEFKALKNK